MEFDREVFDLIPSGNKTFNLIGLKMPSDKDIQPVEKRSPTGGLFLVKWFEKWYNKYE